MRYRVLLIVALAGAPAWAQTKPSATTKPVKGMAAPPPEQLMNSMLKPQQPGGRAPLQPLPDPVRVNPATGKIVPPKPPTPTLMREGSFKNNAVCRLQKSADGLSYQLVFETDGKELADPPMTVLPNQSLASMEQVLLGLNRDPKFHVTGMVTEYNGRNFILIEKATVISDAVQQF